MDSGMGEPEMFASLETTFPHVPIAITRHTSTITIALPFYALHLNGVGCDSIPSRCTRNPI